MNSPAGVPRPTEVSILLSSALSMVFLSSARSVDADIGLASDRGPALDLVLDIGLILRGIEEIHVRAKAAEDAHRIGVVSDRPQCALQHGDRLARRAARREQPRRTRDGQLR